MAAVRLNSTPVITGDYTGVDLSKILGGQTKILEGLKVVKSDKCIGVSQLLGGTCLGCSPQVYAYG